MRPIFRGGTSSKCVRYISRPTTKSLRTHTSAGSTLRQQWKLATALVLGYLTLTLNASTAQGQMDPAEIQRQMEQQMEQQMRGGSQGGHGAAAPNRVVQLSSMVGAGGAAIVRSVREHPRAAAATAVGALTTVWVVTEGRRTGLLLYRRPRITLFRPPDDYLSKMLDTAAGAPIASPLRGVILSPLLGPDAEEELEDETSNDDDREGSGVGAPGGEAKKGSHAARRTPKKVGSGGAKSPSMIPEKGADGIDAAVVKARNARSAGNYKEMTQHGRGEVKSVCAGARLGEGLGLYHKFAQGLGNLDAFDGRSDCELLTTDSSSEDVGSTLALLTRTALGTWSVSPVRVVIRRETSKRGPHANRHGRRHRSERGSRHRSSRRKTRDLKSRKRRVVPRNERPGKEAMEEQEQGSSIEHTEAHRQVKYTLALSAVEGAGWSGTWVFRVTYDAETDEVWFQTTLSQRRGAFGTTAGGDQEARVKKVNEDMLERGRKYVTVLKAREQQLTRHACPLARSRAVDKKALERDRILNPDKYKRVHRYMLEDSYTTGGKTSRPARWGDERRRNDIRLK
ncbi:unnamed protein product [Ascophyllum nodosum]